MKRFVIALAVAALLGGCGEKLTPSGPGSTGSPQGVRPFRWYSGGGTGKTPIGVGSGSPLYIDPPDGAGFSSISGTDLSDTWSPYSPYGLTVTVQSNPYGCWTNTTPPKCTVVVTTDYQPKTGTFATLTFTADASNLNFHWDDGNGGTTFNTAFWRKFGRHAWGFDPGGGINITAVTVNTNKITVTGAVKISIDQ